MAAPLDGLQNFAGATGVGALCLLGVFLALDGFHSAVFPTVEFYAKTATWSIVAAVPVLAITYVLGILLIGVAHFLWGLVPGLPVPTPTDLAAMAGTKDSPAVEAYQQLVQQYEVLSGSGLALLVVAIGAWSERHNLSSIAPVVTWAAGLTVLLAVGSCAVALMRGLQARDVARTAGVSTSAMPSNPRMQPTGQMGVELRSGGELPERTVEQRFVRARA